MSVIAVGGFQHETNTFAPTKADYPAFEHGGGWPQLTRGADIAPRVAGANIPAAGAIETLHALGHKTVGLVWGAASPSAQVTRDAYERIAGDMLARLAVAGPVDGVFPEFGMTVFGYGDDAGRVAGAAAALAHAVADAEGEFSMCLFEPDAAVLRAMQRGEPGAPVVLVDTQDNPGAGGNGDTTGLLAALLKRRASGSVLGLLIDPASAAQAPAVGTGRKAVFTLGETSGVPGHAPLGGEFKVLALRDGRFACTGAMFHGFRMDLGAMALLERHGVRVVHS